MFCRRCRRGLPLLSLSLSRPAPPLALSSSSSRLLAFSSRDGRPLLRRRNVPIKSESHVLPISRQLNLVHAHIAAAIAATRALCQGTPANSSSIDEPSMNIACRAHNLSFLAATSDRISINHLSAYSCHVKMYHSTSRTRVDTPGCSHAQLCVFACRNLFKMQHL